MTTDPTHSAALALAAECPLRLSAALHLRGAYFHVAGPEGGRAACCYATDADPPEGSVPTAAQARLWDELEGEKEGRR